MEPTSEFGSRVGCTDIDDEVTNPLHPYVYPGLVDLNLTMLDIENSRTSRHDTPIEEIVPICCNFAVLRMRTSSPHSQSTSAYRRRPDVNPNAAANGLRGELTLWTHCPST